MRTSARNGQAPGQSAGGTPTRGPCRPCPGYPARGEAGCPGSPGSHAHTRRSAGQERPLLWPQRNLCTTCVHHGRHSTHWRRRSGESGANLMRNWAEKLAQRRTQIALSRGSLGNSPEPCRSPPPSGHPTPPVRLIPPSRTIVSPVIQLASSDSRNRAIAAVSCTSPKRPSG